MIHVEKLSRRYGKFAAVDHVSFTINTGEIVGLLGHNGAGKTTIMKMLTGYLEPSAGTITIDGTDIRSNANGVQRLIGYLPENLPVYPEMSVIDYLFYCAQVRQIAANTQAEAVREAIQKTELAEKALQPISTLSRGYKQRVGVAQALIHNPKILILDEPTNGLDPHQTQQMRQLIRNLARQATVIISTHIMQEVDAICDRVLILDSGQLAVDQTLEELRKSDTLTLSSTITLAKLNALLAEKNPSLTAEQLNAEEFSIKLESESDLRDTSAWLSAAIIANHEQLFALTPLMRDLETVFRNIHQQKHATGEVSNAA